LLGCVKELKEKGVHHDFPKRVPLIEKAKPASNFSAATWANGAPLSFVLFHQCRDMRVVGAH
jgi:hypothetical protein